MNAAEQWSDQYITLIGKKRLAYYVKRFEIFDEQGGGIIPSWNWAAFFFTSIWALYRKMYAVFFLIFGLFFAWAIIDTALSPGSQLDTLVYVAYMVGFGIYGNALYYQHTIRKFTKARTTIPDSEKFHSYIQSRGGVHVWVIWVFLIIPAGAGTLSAIFAPACFWEFWACADEYMIAKAPEDFDEAARARLQTAFDGVEERFNIEGGIQIEEGIRMNSMLLSLQKEKITADELTEITMLLEGIANPDSSAEKSRKVGVDCEIEAYGVLTSQQPANMESSQETFSGRVLKYEGIYIPTNSNYIVIEPELRFGVKHTFTGVPDGENLIVKLIHPQMLKPDGSTTSQQIASISSSSEGTSYGFDHEYEMLPGVWKFEFWYESKLVCLQEFDVSKGGN